MQMVILLIIPVHMPSFPIKCICSTWTKNNQYHKISSIKGTMLLSGGGCASAAAYLLETLLNTLILFTHGLKLVLKISPLTFICQMGLSLAGAALSGVYRVFVLHKKPLFRKLCETLLPHSIIKVRAFFFLTFIVGAPSCGA